MIAAYVRALWILSRGRSVLFTRQARCYSRDVIVLVVLHNGTIKKVLNIIIQLRLVIILVNSLQFCFFFRIVFQLFMGLFPGRHGYILSVHTNLISPLWLISQDYVESAGQIHYVCRCVEINVSFLRLFIILDYAKLEENRKPNKRGIKGHKRETVKRM